jgi:hypothetical protein
MTPEQRFEEAKAESRAYNECQDGDPYQAVSLAVGEAEAFRDWVKDFFPEYPEFAVKFSWEE